MHELNHMVVAYTKGPRPPMLTASSTPHQQPLLESPENVNHFALRDKQSTNYKAEHNTTSSKALKANHKNFHNFVGDVRYMSRTD